MDPHTVAVWSQTAAITPYSAAMGLAFGDCVGSGLRAFGSRSEKKNQIGWNHIETAV
jgi:hypothetical protein